jgi:hypothetical protein
VIDNQTSKIPGKDLVLRNFAALECKIALQFSRTSSDAAVIQVMHCKSTSIQVMHCNSVAIEEMYCNSTKIQVMHLKELYYNQKIEL